MIREEYNSPLAALHRMKHLVLAAGGVPCRWEMTPNALARVLVELRHMSADDVPLDIEGLDCDSIRLLGLPVTCSDVLPGYEVRCVSERPE